MARKHRKTHRRVRRQQGGAFGIDVGHPIQTASGAPLEARASLEDGAAFDRPAPSTAGVGGVLSMMGGRRKSRRVRRQSGGACGCMGIQRGGGGSGTGGFSFTLNNDLGKVYADLPRGSCDLPQRGGSNAVPQRGGSNAVPQRGGSAPIGASESNGMIVSPIAGYGYGPASVFEAKDGSAHFLDYISYGKGAQLNGGRRKKSRRSGHKKQKRSRKH
jgi:hypothetical protein